MDSLSPSTTDLLARDAWLRRLAAAVACDDAHAADLAQETWLRVLRTRLHEPLRDVNAWLATLLHNTARNMERGAARRRRRENIVARDRAEAAADPFDLAVYEERRRTLVAAVEALPPAQRDVVVARYWRGFEPAEIARRNGEDPAAVRQRLRRALARLRAGLDDEGRGGRAAWLAPLWVGARHTTAGAGTGAAVLLGGLGMKKTLVAAGCVLLAMLATGAWMLGRLGPVRAPAVPAPAKVTLRGDPVAGPAEDPAARAAVSPSARRAGTVLPGRLEDASGTPLGDVPYWADERPHRTHPGRAPEGAPRSDGAGGFDAQAEGLGEGAYLWFEIDDGLCIAVERATLGAAPVVRLPRRRDVAVEIRGLPAGEPWRIRAWPGWVDDDEIEHGGAHAATVPSTEPPVWVVRRRTERSAGTGPARASFHLLDGWPWVFYCDAIGYRVEPEIQAFPRLPQVVFADATERRTVVTFEIVESDGTPSDVDGRLELWAEGEPGGWARPFRGGSVRFPIDGEWAARRACVLLHDGEILQVALDDPRIGDGALLRLVRGSGRPPALRLESSEVLLRWPDPKVFVDLGGELRVASSFALFEPFTTWDDVGAWVDGEHVVVQTREGLRTPIGAVFLVSADGRVARREGTRLAPEPSVELEPLVPAALVERWAEPAGATYLQVLEEIELPARDGRPSSGWLTVRVLRLHRVEGLGWRLSRGALIDQHEALPGRLGAFRPRDARSRLRLRLRGGDPIELPHPLR